MLNNKLVKIGLIILAGVVILYLLNMYNNRQEQEVLVEEEEHEKEHFGGHKEPENFEEKKEEKKEVEKIVKEAVANEVVPSEPEENAVFQSVDSAEQQDPMKNDMPKDCYPKDQLSPEELLPGNENSKWAQVNPKGEGELGDQNFLTAGYHVGVNTVGQSLRNANLQLRSEPPNPQVKVSPWLQSTIEPDTNRKPLEIGGCN